MSTFFDKDELWVLLESDESRKRNMYPYHIEPTDKWNRQGPDALGWRLVMWNTQEACYAKLAQLEQRDALLPTPVSALSVPSHRPDKHKKSATSGYVYFLKAGSVVKIGKSTRPPTERVAEYSPRLPFETEIVKVIESNNCHALERELHRRFKSKHVRGEWYALSAEDLK